jgi:hypothetical protein
MKLSTPPGAPKVAADLPPCALRHSGPSADDIACGLR